MKGKKTWLIALLAALAGVTSVLVPELTPVLRDIARPSEPASDPALEEVHKLCASNWSECPPTQSAERSPQP